MKKIVEIYKALGDETRLNIIKLLSNKEMCVCEVIDHLGMSQPAVSHHLKILKQAGIVIDTREGKWIYYSLNPNIFDEAFQGEDLKIIRTYAEPINQAVKKCKESLARTNPDVCERFVKTTPDVYESLVKSED